MSYVPTLDEALDQIDAEKEALQSKKAKKEKAAIEKKKPAAKSDDKAVSDRLSADANNKLDYYMRKTPQYQVLHVQIEKLKEEYKVYKTNGSIENMQKTETLLLELSAKKTRIRSIFKTGVDPLNAMKKKEDLYEKFKNSATIKEFQTELKEIQSTLKENSPAYISSKITEYRKSIALHKGVTGSNEVIEDLDTILSSKKPVTQTTNLEQEYFDYCGTIADRLDIPLDMVLEMSPAKIANEMRKVVVDTEPLKEKITELKMKISTERETIAEGTNLTDLVYEIFDMKSDDEDGAAPREIIASANISLVKSIAYNICSKLNQQSKMDEAVAYGLLGLTVAINKWYSIQKMQDSALSFKGFANTYIAGNIQRGLYELSSGGTASGSTLATMATENKKKINNFVNHNPEFADMDKQVLSDLLAGYDDTNQPLNVISESEYSSAVSGDESESSDIWANAVKDNSSSTEDMVEAKLEYERLLGSIKDLLDLFETKKDKATGIISVTKQKMFSKYDRKLFMMNFGLEYKRTRSTSTNADKLTNHYTQGEMAEELAAMYAADGITKTFSQASLSGKEGRITVMMNKIKFAIEENPKLKAGFEYLFNYWLANTEQMNLLSNNREEIGMKFDRDELREIYSGDNRQLNRQLSDGKKLSDVFEISDNNPLDSDIMDLFNND